MSWFEDFQWKHFTVTVKAGHTRAQDILAALNVGPAANGDTRAAAFPVFHLDEDDGSVFAVAQPLRDPYAVAAGLQQLLALSQQHPGWTFVLEVGEVGVTFEVKAGKVLDGADGELDAFLRAAREHPRPVRSGQERLEVLGTALHEDAHAVLARDGERLRAALKTELEGSSIRTEAGTFVPLATQVVVELGEEIHVACTPAADTQGRSLRAALSAVAGVLTSGFFTLPVALSVRVDGQELGTAENAMELSLLARSI